MILNVLHAITAIIGPWGWLLIGLGLMAWLEDATRKGKP